MIVNALMPIARGLLLVLEVGMAIPALYLFIITISALWASHKARAPRPELESRDAAWPKLAVLVPAHDEELLIGRLISNLSEVEYPSGRLDVYIIADNCSDSTSAIAHGAGWVNVLDRTAKERRGKGYALVWALEQLKANNLQYDAYVFFDADSVVAPQCLSALASAYRRGADVVQGRYVPLNAFESPSTSLRWLALTLMNHVRQLGRSALGSTSTLTGNGMLFSHELLERHPWRAFGLREDYQYYLDLVEHGERVIYAPDAVVKADMPTTFGQMRSQDIRWESDEESSWVAAMRLLKAAVRLRRATPVEAMLELLTPSLSVLAIGSMLTLLAVLAFGWTLPIGLAILNLACIIVHVSSALWLERPPRTFYRSLAYMPLYVCWKLWVNIVVVHLPRRPREWVRTARVMPDRTRNMYVKPLRMAIISFDPYPYEVRAKRLAEAAADCGVEVDAICLSLMGGARLPDRHNGVQIYPLPMARRIGAPLPWTVVEWLVFTVMAAVQVTRLHQIRHYDVIHVHNMPDFLVFAALIPKLQGARVILDVQDVSPELMATKSGRRLRRLLVWLATAQERASAAFADQVVTAGWPFAERLIARGVPPGKLATFINSADPKVFPASLQGPSPFDTNGEQGPFRFMFYGTISRRLGIDTAIRALAIARQEVPFIELDIMGKGDDIPLFQKLAMELGVQEVVHFRDAVAPGPELAKFVVSHDAGVVSYHSDGFADLLLPTKAYEMAWLRRPMIVSDTLAIRSMFRPESVLLCDSECPEAFARAMVNLAHSATLRATMVTNAAKDYERFRWEHERERYYALLQSLAERHAVREIGLDHQAANARLGRGVVGGERR